jgi:heme oxygenase (biliverdin-IX-beta and delta-forming)
VSNPSLRRALYTDADVEQFNILDLLKKRTADIHGLIERRVPVFQEGFNLENYAQLVERFFGFWAPVEDRLSSLRSLQDPQLALQSRLKSSLLRDDLLILRRDPAAVRQCEKLPRLDTFLQGLGCLYVLEGSTLGSQIISRCLKDKLQLGERTGSSFFNAYGGLTGARWSEFKGFVSASVKFEDADNVVEAARETFMCFYDWLGPAS